LTQDSGSDSTEVPSRAVGSTGLGGSVSTTSDVNNEVYIDSRPSCAGASEEAMVQLCIWQLVVGYNLRELKVCEEMKKIN